MNAREALEQAKVAYQGTLIALTTAEQAHAQSTQALLKAEEGLLKAMDELQTAADSNAPEA